MLTSSDVYCTFKRSDSSREAFKDCEVSMEAHLCVRHNFSRASNDYEHTQTLSCGLRTVDTGLLTVAVKSDLPVF